MLLLVLKLSMLFWQDTFVASVIRAYIHVQSSSLILKLAGLGSVERLRAQGSKVRGKVHSRTGHEGPEGEQMYSSTLPSTLTLDGG